MAFPAWLANCLHSQPYIWQVLFNFKPVLGWLDIPAAVEWPVALLWALLDAFYIPVLISLSSLRKPWLGRVGVWRRHSDFVVYLWTPAVFLYKTKGVWNSYSCSGVILGDHHGEMESFAANFFLCFIIVDASFVAYIFLAGLAAWSAYEWLNPEDEEKKEKEDSEKEEKPAKETKDAPDPLWILLRFAFCAACAVSCLYPALYTLSQV